MEKEHNNLGVAVGEVLRQAEPSAPASQLRLDIGLPSAAENDRFELADTHAVDLLGLPKVAQQRARIIAENNAGKGRPRGKHNHKTQAWVEHLLRRYPSPLETLAQIQASPIDALSREVGCSKLEALAEKRKAAEALAPFVHQKLTAIELGPAPTLLQLVAQQDVPDFSVIDGEDYSVLAEASSGTTLTLARQSDVQRASPPQASADQIEAAMGQALDALEQLGRDDPDRARQIRERLARRAG